MIALAAVVVAAVLAGLLLLGGGAGGYSVKADFQNASQLVKGNLVQVGGQPVGKVTAIDLTPDGQAQVSMSIDSDYAPLRVGTQAVVRQASLSGIASRYVDLRLPGQAAEKIPDGGTIAQDSTTSAVDLDQLFNTIDSKTQKDLQKVFKGSAKQYLGKGAEMNAGLLYLNPALASSSRIFQELNRDTPLLERFIVANSKLVTDLADRHADLAGLVDHLATTTTAIGSQQASLAQAIGELPPFMRRANTTFLNLRATLDDLDPLVNDSKPVAKKLRPFLEDLRPFARDARPTISDLADVLKQPGADNDLVDLNNLQPALRDATVRDVTVRGKTRQASFAASAQSLHDYAPEVGFVRPYAPDALGWFDDFSHSGIYDALGAASRVSLNTSAFTLLNGQLSPVPPELRGQAFQAGATLNQRNRCPGSADHKADDGTNPWKPTSDFNCDPSQVLPGK
ncbi:MAG: phospholipid/cholesterol/gamma-HCH transport system substrate-binding protein [Solirubrobacteraceae bacterium]|nr:phospholipid/cholesterol/gamma-HCH transport system substrate-binding protein [Solirubrobacteraceae bacterium]